MPTQPPLSLLPGPRLPSAAGRNLSGAPLERTARASEPGERAPPHEDTPSNAALPPTRPRPRSHTSIAAISRKQERSRARQSEPGMERSDPGNYHMRAGIRGRDQSHPRSRFSVVRTDTSRGHKTDTSETTRATSHDASPASGSVPICRRKCVAYARACTRVTPQMPSPANPRAHRTRPRDSDSSEPERQERRWLVTAGWACSRARSGSPSPAR